MILDLGLSGSNWGRNSKEEPIFYGVADDTLSEAQSAVLQDLIATGEMPEGWVCQQA